MPGTRETVTRHMSHVVEMSLSLNSCDSALTVRWLTMSLQLNAINILGSLRVSPSNSRIITVSVSNNKCLEIDNETPSTKIWKVTAFVLFWTF